MCPPGCRTSGVILAPPSAFMRAQSTVHAMCEVVELDDGDFLELEWAEPDGQQASRPIIIVLSVPGPGKSPLGTDRATARGT